MRTLLELFTEIFGGKVLYALVCLSIYVLVCLSIYTISVLSRKREMFHFFGPLPLKERWIDTYVLLQCSIFS